MLKKKSQKLRIFYLLGEGSHEAMKPSLEEKIFRKAEKLGFSIIKKKKWRAWFDEIQFVGPCETRHKLALELAKTFALWKAVEKELK